MTASGRGGLRGKVLAIRHVAFEDLGILETLLNDAGYLSDSPRKMPLVEDDMADWLGGRAIHTEPSSARPAG